MKKKKIKNVKNNGSSLVYINSLIGKLLMSFCRAKNSKKHVFRLFLCKWLKSAVISAWLVSV